MRFTGGGGPAAPATAAVYAPAMSGRSRVLVTGGEFIGVLAAVRALRLGGYEPWATLSRRRAYAARSRACGGTVNVPDPSTDPDAFASAVARAAGEIGAAAILPGTDSALIAFATRRERVPAGIALGVGSEEQVVRVTDKAILSRLAAEAGIATPPTHELASAAGLADADGITFPAVVKPLASEVPTEDGGLRRVGARRVRDGDELRRTIDALPAGPVLVQPYLRGRLAAICGVAWEGEVVAAAHQVAERIWPPDTGVSAYARTVPRDDLLEGSVRKLLAAADWSGIFQLQFLRTEDEAYLIDLNPRIYGSLALAVAAGLNLPTIWADLLLGRTPRVVGYRVGVRYRSEANDVRAVWRRLRHGPRDEGLRSLLPARRTTHAVFSARDPLPVLAVLSGLRR